MENPFKRRQDRVTVEALEDLARTAVGLGAEISFHPEGDPETVTVKPNGQGGGYTTVSTEGPLSEADAAAPNLDALTGDIPRPE